MSIYINIFGKETLPTSKQYYRVPHDIERMNVDQDDYRYRVDGSRGKPRTVNDEHGEQILNPFPEVYRCVPFQHIIIDCSFQKLWRQLNPMLSNEKWSSLLGNKLAWTNGTGFPGHYNCITGMDEGKPFPRFDQPRFCGGAIITGIEIDKRLKIDAMATELPVMKAAEVMSNIHYWYYGTSVYPDGHIGLIRRLGTDGKYHPVIIPNMMSWQIYLPLNELHKLDKSKPIPEATEFV